MSNGNNSSPAERARPSSRARALVLALGNRFRGDDGVGPYLSDQLRHVVAGCPDIEVLDGVNDAMTIVTAWQGAELALVIDAAVSGAPAGTIHCFDSDQQWSAKPLASCSSHGLGLSEAVELSRVMQRMPERLVVYAIEAGGVEPGAPLSAAVISASDSVLAQIWVQLVPFTALSTEIRDA